jgi:hypothetical protein
MPEGPKGLTFVEESDPMRDPVNGNQTGNTKIKEFIIATMAQENDGSSDELNLDPAIYGLSAPMTVASLTDATYPCASDNDLKEVEIMLLMLQQVTVFRKEIALGRTWPAVSHNPINTSGLNVDKPNPDAQYITYLRWVYELGLRGEQYPLLNNDMDGWLPRSSSAEDIALEGLDDKDHDLTPSNDYIIKRHMRLFYMFGVRDAKKVPEFATDLRSTANDVSQTRAIWVMFFDRVKYWVDRLFLAVAQSDIAQLARNSAQKRVTRHDMPNEYHQLKVDAAFVSFDEKYKKDLILTAWDSLGQTYHYKTDDNVNDAFIRSTLLDEHIEEWLHEYQVDSRALQWALSHAGIGHYERNGDDVHFVVLYNMIVDSGTGAGSYTDMHPFRWTVGLNLALVIDYLNKSSDLGWYKDTTLLLRRKYWTWVDVSAAIEHSGVQCSLLKNLHGILGNPNLYRPLNVMLYAESATWDDETNYFGLYQVRAPSEAFQGGLLDSDLKGNVWLIPYIAPFIHPQKNLYCWDVWKQDEMAELLEFGIVHSTGSNTLLGPVSRYMYMVRDYVEVVQIKNTAIRDGWITAEQEVHRFEHLFDVLTTDGNTIKYSMRLEQKTMSYRWFQGPSRLHGVHNAIVCSYNNAAVTYENAHHMWFFLLPESGGGAKAEPPQVDTKPKSLGANVVKESTIAEVNTPTSQEVVE